MGIDLLWTFSGSSSGLFCISWVCWAGTLDLFSQWDALITWLLSFPHAIGDMNLTAVPSGSTWWWPCLHKPDFKSLLEVHWPQIQAPVIQQLVTCRSPCQMTAVFSLGCTTCGWHAGVVSTTVRCLQRMKGTPEHLQILLIYMTVFGFWFRFFYWTFF